MDTYDPMDKWRSLRQRSFKEILLYIAVSSLIIAAIFGMFAMGLSWDAFAKWIGLAIFTAIPFGYFVSDSRALWKTKTFWVFTVACLFVHCAAWTIILVRVQHWKVIWFGPVIIELAILVFLRDRWFRGSHSKLKR
jgi:hypothetical protein